MESRNLSIGDWVCIGECGQHVGEIGSVVAISAESNYVGILTTHIIEECEDDVLPIPLTPEILNQNGFRLVVKNNRFDDWHNHPITVRKYDYEDHYRLIVNGWVMPFKMFSVHQLQHALRLLEVDKDIRL